MRIGGVFLLVSVGSAATLAAGCLFPSFDGMESSSIGGASDRVTGQRAVSDAAATAAADPAVDVGVAEDASAVVLADAADAGDEGCQAQQVDWTVDGGSCSAAFDGNLDAGGGVTLDDHELSDTGRVTVTCSGGALVLSDAVCEPPRKFNLSSPTACGNGFCMGVTPGQCGVPDPDRAKAICVKKGYVDQTGFDTAPSTPGTNLCLADGVTCAVTQNATCTIIFTAVFCRH